MSVEKYREQLARVLESMKQTKEPSDAGIADLRSAMAQLRGAEAASSVTSGPSTVRGTLESDKEQEISSLRGLEDLYKSAIETARETAQLRSQLEEITRARKAEEARKIELDASGKSKTPWSRSAYEALVTTRSSAPEVVEYQQLNDVACMVREFCRFQRATGKQILPFKNFEDSNAYRRLQEASVRGLYSTGANAGDEFVATILSSSVMDKFEMERGVAKNIPSFTMPRGEFSLPVVTANPTIYLQNERTSDPGADYKASQLSSDARSFICKTLAGLTYWSEELDEDSIAAVADFQTRAFGAALASAEEDIIINGDTANTLDTGISMAADDHRLAWDGFRKLAQSGAKTAVATWSTANFLAAVAKMGKYAVPLSKVVMIPSVSMYFKYIVPSTDIATHEKVGMLAANMTGVATVFYGMPVIPSDHVSTELNTSGIYDGSTKTKTAIVFARPDQYLMGVKRGMRIEVERDIKTGQLAMVCTMREIMKKIAPTTALSEGWTYNMD